MPETVKLKELPTRVNAPEFWRWAYTDFLSNTLRGVLAEFVVALAAGCTARPRVEWDAYDLVTEGGLKIEVKSAAYLQTWTQKRLSPIRFDIAERRADTTVIAPSLQATRRADVYIFCVFTTQERKQADPLQLAQWCFLTCTTAQLVDKFGPQKTVSLSALEALGLPRLNFAGLCAELQQLSGQPHLGTSRSQSSEP